MDLKCQAFKLEIPLLVDILGYLRKCWFSSLFGRFKKILQEGSYNDFSLYVLVVPGVAEGYGFTQELYGEQGPHSSGQRSGQNVPCRRPGQEVALWPKTS